MWEARLRELAPEVLAAVARRTPDFAAAEDAVQEALVAAAQSWGDGVPASPKGWLIEVARRRLVDAARSEMARRAREAEVARWQSASGGWEEEEDDTLQLLFLCCHPALTPAAAIALTLRAVGGLRTGEIARAFLVSEATMGQRISRAKQTLAAAGARFTPLESKEWRARLRWVLHVLHLMFNEGYAATSGERLVRVDLSDEAIRLARCLARMTPDEPEALGLLALLLLTDARRAARTGPLGELIPLTDQNRELWNQEQIGEGVALLTRAMGMGAVGVSDPGGDCGGA